MAACGPSNSRTRRRSPGRRFRRRGRRCPSPRQEAAGWGRPGSRANTARAARCIAFGFSSVRAGPPKLRRHCCLTRTPGASHRFVWGAGRVTPFCIGRVAVLADVVLSLCFHTFRDPCLRARFPGVLTASTSPWGARYWALHRDQRGAGAQPGQGAVARCQGPHARAGSGAVVGSGATKGADRHSDVGAAAPT